MSIILLSVHPRHVEKILSGEKKYEYRKSTGLQPVEKIIIYSCSPVKMLVAEAEVECTLNASPQKIWRQTHFNAGITEKFFCKYFSGKSVAVAYKLGKITRYEPARELSSLGLRRGPQSFVYIEPVSFL